MLIEVTNRFRFSPDGIQVDAYTPGVQEVPSAAAEFALANALGRRVDSAAADTDHSFIRRKMIRAAPRNKSA